MKTEDEGNTTELRFSEDTKIKDIARQILSALYDLALRFHNKVGGWKITIEYGEHND